MPKRFDAYRMKDGATPLSEAFFNPVFGDIDSRIADLEERRADLQAVMEELSKFGLQRIDVLTSRAMNEMNAVLVELRDVRDELTAGTKLAAAIQAEQSARGQAIAQAVQAEAVARTEAVAELASASAAAMAQEAAARAAAIAQATALPSAATITYDAAGRVSGATETLPAGERITTFTYADGDRVASMAVALAGNTRITTYGYDGQGRMGGYAVVEG